MLETELAFANEMAGRAAEVGMSLFHGEFEIQTKVDLSPVTDADIRIEAMFREEVARRFPDDAVLGEESGLQGEGDRVWVIDPIDGTKNFADGIQLWATLIALQIDGESVLGVVSLPGFGERYAAVKGGGATLNGRPIQVSTCDRVSRSFVAFSSVDGWLNSDSADTFTDLISSARRNRGFGDAWGHVLVARGAADVMMEQELSTWDWAAFKIVVEEAGGRVTTLEGAEPFHGSSILTTNGLIHEEVLARMRGPVKRY